MPTPHVIFGDEARARLKEGIDLLAQVVSLTLGPRAGIVAATRDSKVRGPETLTSSAVIARRIVEIPGRSANVGTMMLRHALWQVHEQLGDGGATTAALVHALLAAGQRQLAAGANPMLLRRGMERGLETALEALARQARPLEGERHLGGLAHAATGDPDLSAALGEIFGRLGPEGVVTIEEYSATYVATKFLEGVSWQGGFVSPHFIADEANRRTRLAAPRVLVTDQTIDQPRQLIPLLERIVRAQAGPLLLLAGDVTGQARAMLLANRARGVIDVAAAKLAIGGQERRQLLEDIAVFTNAYLFAQDRGDRLEEAELSELGAARIAQVEPEKITFVGPAGHPPLIEARRQTLRHQLAQATEEAERKKIVERLGKLAGGMAVLKLGAASDSERAVRKELAERFIRFVPIALEEGVVPGGGAAYLACQQALAPLISAGDEEATGALLVRDALEAPMTWLARNAGQPPAVVLAEVRRHGAGYGYDVVGEQVADMWQANILDAAKVTRVALETAVSIAAMVLTTEAIVLKRRPVVSTKP
jgi:chaperonin GroEL